MLCPYSLGCIFEMVMHLDLIVICRLSEPGGYKSGWAHLVLADCVSFLFPKFIPVRFQTRTSAPCYDLAYHQSP
jgi:hypothetical protein